MSVRPALGSTPVYDLAIASPENSRMGVITKPYYVSSAWRTVFSPDVLHTGVPPRRLGSATVCRWEYFKPGRIVLAGASGKTFWSWAAPRMNFAGPLPYYVNGPAQDAGFGSQAPGCGNPALPFKFHPSRPHGAFHEVPLSHTLVVYNGGTGRYCDTV